MSHDVVRQIAPSRVMEEIWSHSEGKHVFLPQLTDTGWIEPTPTLLPAPGLDTALSYRDPKNDHYFTPLRYDGTHRRKDSVGRPGVIFADLDGDTEPYYCGLPPSILINTSPNHFHGYWFLEEPMDPEEWELIAKGYTQALGADPAGWDITQVLRTPGFFNHKTTPPHFVRLTVWRPELVYPASAFPKASISSASVDARAPVPNPQRHKDVLAFNWPTLPLGARYWLTATPQELKALGKIDRSKILWGLECDLLESGIRPVDVFHMISFSGINKHEATVLWKEILKAQAHVGA